MTELPNQLYRKDTRSPNSPYHPALPAPCGHAFNVPHNKVHWTNKPSAIGGWTCDSTPPRIEGEQLEVPFEEFAPAQQELF